MSKVQRFFSKCRLLWFIVSILLALAISTLVYGGDGAMANLFHFFSVSNSRISGEHFFSAWITFFFFAITDRLATGEWKISPGYTKCVFGAMLAFYLYNHVSTDMMKDGLNNPDNWFTVSMTYVGSFFNWLSGCMPDWFYADGWLNLWWFIRTLIRLFFCLLLMYITIPYILAIPFGILYEVWHNKKDMPSATYEWFAVLVIYPVFFYLSLWITYHCEFYNGWFLRILYLISSSVVIWMMAGFRNRCPKCGGSRINILREKIYKGRKEYTGTTIEKTTVFSGTTAHTYRKTTDHYKQRTYTDTYYGCRRCANKWWETQVSTSNHDKVSYD